MNLDQCKCEFQISGSRPFYFDYTGQKVMLITSIPSFQAVYRRLASTRFFRHVFLSLFGPAPAIGNQSLISFFQENIYWTHYHKCFLPIGHVHDYKNPPEICRKRHLDGEINQYKPKIIVIFGAPVVKRLTGRALDGDYMETEIRSRSGRVIKTLCTNFPGTGAEVSMIKIREKLEPIVPQVDVTPVPDSMISPCAREKDTFKIHALYELNALKYYWGVIKTKREPIFVGEKNIDDLWIQREVIPAWFHYFFIVNCCSFIEDQVSALLAENPDLRPLCRRNFMECLRELFKLYMNEELLANRPDLAEGIELLRNIRHRIVHQGGRINPLDERDIRLRQIIRRHKGLGLEPGGHIVVDEQFCEQALALVERFVRYITQFDTRY